MNWQNQDPLPLRPVPEAAEPSRGALPEGMAAEEIARLEQRIGQVIKGKQGIIRLATVCLLSKGHILIEDVPGVGKTTLAQALARSLGLAFQRIQFTSDLLPSDILGVSIYRQRLEDFEWIAGPIFSNIVLADEINRASPKTQSALLEAMSERWVSVDRERRALPEPFLVVATQNPLEYVGTFPLPESQLDRFMMSLRLGYPPRREERELLLSGGVQDALEELEPALDEGGILALQAAARSIHVAEKLADYILSIAEATRVSQEFDLGVSTRGAQNLYRAMQAMALCEGRSFAIPDDLQRVAGPVLGHRVILRSNGGGLDATREAIDRIVSSVPVPI